jgi:hypothetical protein
MGGMVMDGYQTMEDNMNVARNLQMAGEITPVLLSKHGFYANGMPAELSIPRQLYGCWLELALRGRLCAKGFVRGLQGTGIFGIGRLYASVIRSNGDIEHLGLLSTKLITDAGVAFLVDDWDNNGQDLSTMNFHGCGTGAVAEAVGDTALGAESTTILNPASTRATGTRSQPAANQYRSVGTLTFSGSGAITEHGVFSQSATGGGALWDRSVFSAINVSTGDSIQFTYTCTFSSGG